MNIQPFDILIIIGFLFLMGICIYFLIQLADDKIKCVADPIDYYNSKMANFSKAYCFCSPINLEKS